MDSGRDNVINRNAFPRRTVLAPLLAVGLLAGATILPASSTFSQQPPPLGELSVVYVDSHSPAYIPGALGLKLGVWKKRGLEVKYLLVHGGGQANQIQLAGKADVAITGGITGIAAMAKGLPARFVGDFSSQYSSFVMVVPKNSQAHSPADMRGKRIGITSPGSLTEFLARKVPDAITVPVGGFNEQMAALERGTTDGFVWPAEAGFTLEEQKAGHAAFDYGSIVKPNLVECLQATTSLIENRPKVLQAYLDGYYEAVAYVKAHRTEMIDFVANEFSTTNYVATELYDSIAKDMSSDGEVPTSYLEELARVAHDAGTVAQIQDVKTYWNGSFVPAKPDRVKY
jgi:ABC-type nitrate/sulfonate/bicarbonate transport system substrate-binding protein